MHVAQDDQAIAAFFDECARKQLMYTFDTLEQARLERFLAQWDIRSGQRILEPGCGAGRLTQVLASATGPGGEVYANDLSPAMIQLARERALPSHVHFSCESVLHLECEDGRFDRIICLNVFPHFGDKAGVLCELARVLKPDGRLWVNHFKSRDELNQFHQQAAPELDGHVLPCRHAMCRLFADAGLDVEEILDGADGYSLEAVKRASVEGG